MKKLFLGLIFLASVIVVPLPSIAGVDVSIGISLPPPVVFEAPPEVIVLPDTDDVYVVPDIEVDLFFWGGWWWRLWDGHWYRSRYYNRGWVYYRTVPSFYFDIDPGWRGYYRSHDWYGHRWDYERVPYRQFQRNWKSWRSNRHWERQRTWGVEGYQPRPKQQRMELRQQRQEQYRQRPEVQRLQQQKQPQVKQQKQLKQRKPEVKQFQGQPRRLEKQQKEPQVRKPQGQLKPQGEMKPQKQFKGSQRKEESQGQKSPGKFKEGDEKHIK